MFSSISALLVITASLEFVCVYCLNNNLSRRIIGGHDSEDYWPFYVNITWTDTETGGPGGCGGILIDEQHILSAAHFFYGSPVLYEKDNTEAAKKKKEKEGKNRTPKITDPKPKRTANLGDFRENGAITTIPIVSYMWHKEVDRKPSEQPLAKRVPKRYDPASSAINDIALARLKRPWKVPNSEIKICTEVDHSVGGLYTAIGMGLRIEGDHNSLPGVLQETVLKEDPTGNSCGNFRKMEPTTQICLKKPDARVTATGPGDSGGPIVLVDDIRGKRVARCAYGMTSCAYCDGSGGLYMRLSNYRQWIKTAKVCL
ncbi:duodenase-1-like isoform X2 [Convolutriloba macropyga]|uniref:duodenase-1-like isoform X2 n=1 Tax=Convolutriloba macropyga TaxID=536237 RepID=UPI003F51C2F2